MADPPPEPAGPSYAEENALRVASESLQRYDEEADTFHCTYGPPVPAVSVHDPERDLLVRVDPRSQAVVGFSIPDFRAWHAAHAEPDGNFEVDLPPVWPLRPEEGEAG